MSLFSHLDEYRQQNLLPYDGEVYDFEVIFDKEIADGLLNRLQAEISWQQDRLKMYGKPIVTKRKSAWHADQPYSYGYSGFRRIACPWNSLLETIRHRIIEITKRQYNACLLNYYQDGSQAMGWHADDEVEIKPDSAIASLSFGATRKFCFKHRQTQEKLALSLTQGQLIMMAGCTQRYWLHSLPATKKVHQLRINLTFRNMLSQAEPIANASP